MAVENGWIRQFRPDDAGACSDIVCSCLKLDPMIPTAVKHELLRLESPETMLKRAKLFYLAVCIMENQLLGVAGVDMNEIRLLFVDPAHQRKGIGSSLLRHVEALVPPGLFHVIFIYSAQSAVCFYQGHGYQPGGEYPFHVGGHTVPTIFMTKRLDM